MTKLYKLTDENSQTYTSTKWGPNVSHSTSGEGDLCGEGWLHAYTHPLLAVLLNPIHANFKNPILWEAKGIVGKSDYGLKIGCKKLTTLRQIEIPTLTAEQRIKFAILCAKSVCEDKVWNAWADKWLDGDGRSKAWADKWLDGDGRSKAWAAAAAWAAKAATEAYEKPLDFIALAKKAMED